MLDKQDLVTGYPDSPAVSEGCDGDLTYDADPNFDKFLEFVDDVDEWDLDGTIRGEPT